MAANHRVTELEIKNPRISVYKITRGVRATGGFSVCTPKQPSALTSSSPVLPNCVPYPTAIYTFWVKYKKKGNKPKAASTF